MRKLKNLFENNRRWAARTSENDPEFFKILSTSDLAKGDVPTFESRYSFCISTDSKQVSFCLILSNFFIEDL